MQPRINKYAAKYIHADNLQLISGNESTEFGNLAQSARMQGELRLGTPATIEDRLRRHGLYPYHRNYDPSGKLCEAYISGPLGTPTADTARADVFIAVEINQFLKTQKDWQQVATLVCAIEDKSPGVIADAMS